MKETTSYAIKHNQIFSAGISKYGLDHPMTRWENPQKIVENTEADLARLPYPDRQIITGQLGKTLVVTMSQSDIVIIDKN